MQLFYTAEFNPAEKLALLDEEESHHCLQVLRKQHGDPLQLTDGQGHLIQGTLVVKGKKKCMVEVAHYSLLPRTRTANLHIAMAPPKNSERFEWFLEKAAEIGVDEITPLQCDRSERNRLRSDRMQKVLLAAMKQSGQTYLPRLNPMTDSKKLFARPDNRTRKFIAHCVGDERTSFKTACQPDNDTLVCIGPEGDFSPDEIALALSNGWTPVSLGPTRLRTETAGIVACATFNLLLQT